MLKTVKLVALAAAFLMSTMGGMIHAQSVIKLGGSSKTKSVQVLGEAPKKKLIVLKLGALRSGEPDLPSRLLTRQERMKLRAERAIERQQQVAVAKRERRTGSRTARHRNPDGNAAPPPQNDVQNDIVVDEQGNPVME